MKSLSILETLLNSVQASIIGGITWDIIKTAGKGLIDKFKDKFKKNGSFETDDQCESFLKDIATKTPNSRKC